MRTTIVIPCYNEQRRLPVESFFDYVEQGHTQRFLLVNDGSTDGTLGVLNRMAARHPSWIEVLDLPVNRGKAEAVRQGVLHALADGAEAVGFWDADLATPLAALPEFCDLLSRRPEIDILMGARVRLLGRNVQRRWLRHYLGRVFATFTSLLLRLPVYDTQCGAKLFRVTPATAACFAAPFRTSWIFDVELLGRFLHSDVGSPGDRAEAICEIPLHEWAEIAGSKVKPRHFVQAFVQLAVVYWTCLRPGARPRWQQVTASLQALPSQQTEHAVAVAIPARPANDQPGEPRADPARHRRSA